MTEQHSQFIRKLAKSGTGRELIKYLKDVEIEYADIRNLKGTSAEVRIDALKIIREVLLDKLLVLGGQAEPPDGNEWN